MSSQRGAVLPAVLAVGTDGGDASALASALSDAPFDVTVAAADDELRRTLTERQVACVLCQHARTDPVPRTIVETVRSESATVPILVATDPEHAGPTLEAGATDVVRQLGDEAGTGVDEEILTARLSRLVRDRDRANEYQRLFEQASDGIAVHEADGAIQRANRAFYELLGYDPDETDEITLGKIAAGDGPYTEEKARSAVRETLEAGEQSFEWLAATADGERFLVEVTLKPTTVAGQRRVVEIVHDISDQKRREQYIEVMHRILRHDLRNRLNVVMGLLETLATDVADQAVAERIGEARDKVSDVTTLHERAIVIERAIERRGEQIEHYDVASDLREAVAEARNAFPRASITLDAPANLRVRATEDIRVAIDELVQNAVEHDHSTEPTLDITVRTVDSGNRARLEFRDSGPGIPDGEWEIITGQKDISQLRHASGLGLWLTQWVVDSFGGDLLRAAGDDGSTVVIELDAIPADG